ncbi:spore coat protein [Aneurinibacillus tyrosinisolvens]|uniref:spore coat protein n=1 Tax=Aneurinibacillus tyrosinisolvens TaxID=1443435 RepID=UPI00063ED456|nr:spore coat protein [Aneurinibacillus tyrosinisolvens]
MNQLMENITNTGAMTDQVIAYDLPFASKFGTTSYAKAITEAATPEVREILRKHQEENIAMHGKVTTYMVNKGYYHPYNVKEQLQLDMKKADIYVSAFPIFMP